MPLLQHLLYAAAQIELSRLQCSGRCNLLGRPQKDVAVALPSCYFILFLIIGTNASQS